MHIHHQAVQANICSCVQEPHNCSRLQPQRLTINFLVSLHTQHGSAVGKKTNTCQFLKQDPDPFCLHFIGQSKSQDQVYFLVEQGHIISGERDSLQGAWTSVLSNNTFIMCIFILSPGSSSLKLAFPQNHLDKCSKTDNQGCVFFKLTFNWRIIALQ